MGTTSRVILLLTLLGPLTACSVYRNKGRDQFEARAAGQVKTNIGVSKKEPTEDVQLRADSETCWMQDASEALWSTPVGSSLEVTRINESQISVCLVETSKHEESNND